jgi:uncharacterized protein (TIGR00251 family)
MSGAAQVSLREAAGSVWIKVAARPGTRDGVLGVQGDALKLGVSAAPDKGKANKALVELLASVLGVRKSAVLLAQGETAREKLFKIDGASLSSVRAALEKALG